MKVGKYAVYFIEGVIGVILAWLLTSYVFLSFWANQWEFTDVIAWMIIGVVAVVVTGLMWLVHHFVIKRFI